MKNKEKRNEQEGWNVEEDVREREKVITSSKTRARMLRERAWETKQAEQFFKHLNMYTGNVLRLVFLSPSMLPCTQCLTDLDFKSSTCQQSETLQKEEITGKWQKKKKENLQINYRCLKFQNWSWQNQNIFTQSRTDMDLSTSCVHKYTDTKPHTVWVQFISIYLVTYLHQY